MKGRSDDPSQYERTLLPRSYISLSVFRVNKEVPERLPNVPASLLFMVLKPNPNLSLVLKPNPNLSLVLKLTLSLKPNLILTPKIPEIPNSKT